MTFHGGLSASKGVRIAIVASCVVAVLVAVLHATPVRRLVRDRLIDWARHSADVHVSLDDLSYNLLTLNIRLRGLTVSAVGSETPFLSAQEVRLDVPWRALFGSLSLERAELIAPSVMLVRGQDGSLNLPPSSATSEGKGLSRFDISHLRVDRAALHYHDEPARVAVDVDDLAIGLDPGRDGTGEGRISIGRPAQIRVGDLSTDTSLQGRFSYDGTTLGLADIALASDLARLQVDGRVNLFGPVATANLEVGGSASVDAISSAFQLAPAATGTIAIDGAFEGALDAPTATLSLTSDRLTWRHLAVTQLNTRAVATTKALTIDQLNAAIGGGALTVQGRLDLDSLRTTAHARWNDIAATDLLGPYAPVPVGSRLGGSVDVDGSLSNGLSGLRVNARVKNDAAPTGRAIGIGGNLALDLSDGDWHLTGTQLAGDAVNLSARLSGRFDDGRLLDSTLSGAVDVTADRPAQLVSMLRTAGIDVPQWSRPQSGRLVATARVNGTLGEPRATGRLQATGVRLAASEPIDADVMFAADRAMLNVSNLSASTGRNRLDGRGSFNLRSQALAANAELSVIDFTALGAAVSEWRPSGEVRAQASVTGSASKPVVHATLTGNALTVAGQQVADLSGDVSYDGSIVSVPSFVLTQTDSGRLSLNGDYSTRTGESSIVLRVDQLRVTPIETPTRSLPLTAVIDGRLDARGTLEHPSGDGQFTMANLHWDEMSLTRADGEVALSDAGVELTLQAPDLALVARATVEPRAPYALTVAATARETSVRTLLSSLGAPSQPAIDALQGVIGGNITASGNLEDLASIGGDVTLEQVALTAGEAELRLEQPSRAMYANSRLSISGLRLRTGQTTIDVSGEIAPTAGAGLSASVAGRISDVEPWLRVAGVPATVATDGALAASVRADGSFDRLQLSGSLDIDEGSVSWPGYPPVNSLTVHATLADSVLETTSLTARSGEMHVDGRVRLPLRLLEASLPAAVVAGLSGTERAAIAQLRADNITPSVFAPLVSEGRLDNVAGQASLQATVRADAPAIDQITGSITLTGLDLTVANLPVQQVRPTRLDIAGGRLRAADWAWNLAGSPFNVAGDTALSSDGDLDVRVNGRIDLRILGAFVPSVTTSGTGELSVSIGGTTGAPVAEGRVLVQNGELRVADPPLALSGLDGALDLRPNRLDIGEMTGMLNGGAVTASGGFNYEGFSLTGGAVSLNATGIALNVPAGMRSEVDAELNATVGERIEISGRVELVQGGYREPISLAAAIAAATSARASTTGEQAISSTLAGIDLDVAVSSREDLIVDNNYGRMDLGLDLRLVGTAAAPSLIGRAAIREGGLLYLGGRTYLVERGLIDFSDPRAIVPELDLSARTRINGTDESGAAADYDITMSITGTPEDLKTTLTSDPDRGQADIVSLLATGRLADQVGGAGGGALAAEQVLGYLSGEALGFAARAVGLDSIRFEQGVGQQALEADPSIAAEVNPSQRLTVSRRLSRMVEVTVSQNLRDAGLFTWIVTFAPRRNVEIRTVSLDDRDRSYEVRHDLSFGGPPVSSSSPSRGAPGRVSAVLLTGELRFPRHEVEGALHLKAGDRFDFYRWQDDRERLRRFYLDRGYREVRVSARQSPAPGADRSVQLEYDVESGPLTELLIEGYSLPPDVVRELERLWSNSVVDVALIDDLRNTIRRHLAERGFLRATVRVEHVTQDAADIKRIRASIEPGPHSSSRSIHATGNERVSTDDIEAAAARVGIEAWLTPRTLADEVALQYRQLGLLSASVQAGPVEFTADSAVLPVVIHEGPQFTISRVVLDGVHHRDENAVRGDLGLEAGQPYTPDLLTQARRALSRAYAREGFTEMRGDIDAVVNREQAGVEIRVRVEERARQVLSAVAVTGQADVRQSVIDGALKLSDGAPVDMDAWYAGRRRLFQTGLFRRVDIEPVPIDTTGGKPEEQPVRAELMLVRRAPWRLRYGLSVTDETAPIAEQGRVFGGGLNANLERFGLFGWAGTAVLSGRYNNDQRVVRGALAWPTLFGRSIASRLFLGRSRDIVEGEGITAFITDRTVITAEQRMTLGPRVLLAYAYQSERNHLFDPDGDPTDPFTLNERWNQSRLTSSFVFDTRSDPFSPTSGQMHSSSLEFGLAVLGRNGRFLKYSAQEFVFARLLPTIVSASAFRLNVGKGFRQDLILSERFFAGGLNTVRGYPEDALGGYDVFGDPIPGQASLVLNQEVRFPVFRWIGGAAFIDAGNVFERASDLSLRALQVGAGLGMRVSTPVGLLRIDVAAPVPRHDREFRWTFGFGHIF